MTKRTSPQAVSPKRSGPKSPPTKLTERQLSVLSRAARRRDAAVTSTGGTKDKAACKLAATLAAKGLMREVRTKPGMPVWCKSEGEGARSLVITKLGRASLGVEGRDETNGVDGFASNSLNKKAATAALGSNAATLRVGSKLAEVIGLLMRKEGARITELISATGWLAHTTRATLTGLRKRGYAIARERAGKGEASIYRIVNGPAHAKAA